MISTRGRLARTVALLLVPLLVAACGDDDSASDGSSGGGADEGAEEASGESADTEAFPVEIEHKFGVTTIEEEPERVVVVGLLEQDPLLALGVVPVATTEWFGEYPGSVWPWAQDELEALGGDVPESLGDATAFNFEAVAAQDPDLILALYSELEESDYEKFSAIAPTVAQPGEYDNFGIPWDEMTLTVGEAVGKADEAQALVDEVEALFDEAKADHPEFVGASAVVATPYEGIYVYGGDDVRGRLLTSLGFELPADLEEVTGEQYGGSISPEQADFLDLDLVVWLDYAEAAGSDAAALYESLDVHTEGREVHVDSYDDPLGGATSFVTVLSLPFLLDGIVPMMAAAIDGDPATEADGS